MNKISNNELGTGRNLPWSSLFLLVIFVFMGLFIGQGIGVLISMLLTGLSLEQLPQLISEPFTEEKRVPIYLLQGFGTIGGFIISGMIYLRYFELVQPLKLFKKISGPGIILLSALMVVAFMFANSVLIEWNSNIHFPDSFGGFASWAKGKEEEMKLVTDFITRFTSPGDFILGFIIIAVLPALGEEFLFRGIIQNKLELVIRNGHAAIWITAVLFSAFHFQFFGFIPRMMLGLLFGYMYYWSRNLWFPVTAHFINNGFTVTMIYLYNQGIININIEEDKSFPWTATLIFGLIGFLLLFYFRQFFKQEFSVSNG